MLPRSEAKENFALHWLLVSFLLHLLLIYVVLLRTTPSKAPELVEVQLRDEKPEALSLANKQIVDIPELGRRLKPKNARFLSEHDQTVDQENLRKAWRRHSETEPRGCGFGARAPL